MAIYKEDIVDINLETGNIHRSFLAHSIGYKDQKADHFGVRVFRGKDAVDLTGVSVQGIFMPPQGDPIAITSGNSVSGNVAYVVLPQACYNYDGQFCLAIKLVDSTNSITGTVRIVDGVVDNTHASGTVAPTSAVPTYQEILSSYDAMVAATAAANGAIAATYSSSATYAVGDYCIHDGGLYRCTTAITTAEAWTSGHWTAAKLGTDLSAQKSALYAATGNKQIDMTTGAYYPLNGSSITIGSPTPYDTEKYALVPCSAGDVFTISGTGGSSARPWGFVESDGTIISTKGNSTTVTITKEVVIAPTNAAYLVLNNQTSNDGISYYGRILLDETNDIKSAINEDRNIIDQIVAIGNKYDYTKRITDKIINSTGSISTSEGFDTSGYIHVMPNTYYMAKIWSPTGEDWYTSSIGRVNYYDENKTLIDSDHSSSSLSSGTSLSPVNAKYARFTVDNTRTGYADYPNQFRYAVFTETANFPDTFVEYCTDVKIPDLESLEKIVDGTNEYTQNLFYFTDPTDFTKNGVSVQFLDRSTIKAYGTATGTFTIPISIPHLPNGTYSIRREFITPPSPRNPHLKINGTNSNDGTFTIASTDNITIELTKNNLIDTTVRWTVVPGTKMIKYVQGGMSAYDAVARQYIDEIQQNDNTVAGIEAANDIFSTVDSLNNVNTANICFFTDTHDTDDAMADYVSCFNELNNLGIMDLCVHGGDFVDNDATTTKETAMNQLKSAKKIMSRLTMPHIGLVGNHDQNVRDYDETTNYIKRSEMAFQIFNPMNTISCEPLMTGYFDIPRAKIRVICLNTSDLPVGNDGYYTIQPLSTFLISQEQLDWLANVALKTPAEYEIAIFAHTMPLKSVAEAWGVSQYSAITNGAVLWAMLAARKNKTVYQKSDTKSYTIMQRDTSGSIVYQSYSMAFSCDYDFTGYESTEYIGWFNGHTHADYLSSLSDTGLMPVCATSLAGTKSSRSATIAETHADIITIDTKAKTVHLTRLGLGDSRSFSYGT